jgi:hypothetical protein
VHRAQQSSFIGIVVNRDKVDADILRLEENRGTADGQFPYTTRSEAASGRSRLGWSSGMPANTAHQPPFRRSAAVA